MTPEAAVAQLAASLLAHEIDASILASLQQPETAALLKQIEPFAADLLERDWAPRDFEEAAFEFCRLFSLNPAVPPRAAAYDAERSNQIAGRIQFMLDSGLLELPATYQSLAVDHIALLLLVYSSLGAEDALQFKMDNLAWLPQFSERLEQESEHAFYLLASKILQIV